MQKRVDGESQTHRHYYHADDREGSDGPLVVEISLVKRLRLRKEVVVRADTSHDGWLGVVLEGGPARPPDPGVGLEEVALGLLDVNSIAAVHDPPVVGGDGHDPQQEPHHQETGHHGEHAALHQHTEGR